MRPRNIIDDPFVVRDNRETIAGELLLVYDPTPGTWFHTWDRDIRENADFVAALDIWYRHQPEQRDASTFTLGDGSIAAFGAAPPAEDEWEVKLHTVHNPSRDVRVVSTLLAGEGQSRGEDPRLIRRYGVDIRTWWRTFRIDTKLHLDDWGPYDFHRDFNLTYPLQWYYRRLVWFGTCRSGGAWNAVWRARAVSHSRRKFCRIRARSRRLE